jgi:plasmid stability protein
MTITIGNLPDDVERALRERANIEHKSIDEAAADALARGLGVTTRNVPTTAQFRDLSDIAGSGGIDDAMEAGFWEHRRIEPDAWK